MNDDFGKIIDDTARQIENGETPLDTRSQDERRFSENLSSSQVVADIRSCIKELEYCIELGEETAAGNNTRMINTFLRKLNTIDSSQYVDLLGEIKCKFPERFPA